MQVSFSKVRFVAALVLSGLMAQFCWAQDAAKNQLPAPLPSDISVALVETTMRSHPDATSLGKWGYIPALYLSGEYLVYKRTGDARYLAYIRSWADAHVDAQGKIDNALNALDYMLPGNLMLDLYKETGLEKYKIAAQTIRKRLDTYPRTEDGGLWHATTRQHQLWLDGMYMSMPFLVHYGEAFGDQAYAYDEASKQLLLYAKHLNDPATGLMFHAYDESGTQPWAQADTHHSSVFWARSIGWFGMTLVDVLETMPKTDPNRPKLIVQLQQLVQAYAKYQDPKTGLWYNVVDKAGLAGNWEETSASSMYTYTISRAVQRGYVDSTYEAVACKGYRGVLSQVSVDGKGDLHVANVCQGTNVADLSYYLNRPHPADDLHGLGAFLIMNEQMRTSSCAASLASHITLASPMDYQVFQRQTKMRGAIAVRGEADLAVAKVEARITGNGLAGPLAGHWQKVLVDPRTGEFHSDVATTSGGFYSVEIRVRHDAKHTDTTTVAHVGVGEVFVVSGQSNSTNYGEVPQVTQTGMVTTFSGAAWRLANDPQPGVQDNSKKGSFIPSFGDAMYRKYHVPIGVASVGHGSTSVRQWLPAGDAVEVMPTMTRFIVTGADGKLTSDGTLYNGMMTRIEQLGVHGFRAVLWHQGESDAHQPAEHEISAETYRRMLEHVIQSTRKDAGWDIPWFVAEVSYHTPEDTSVPALRAAQSSLWSSGVALQGPDTDTLGTAYRQNNGKGIHFSDAGLKAHGLLWAQAVEVYLDRELSRK